MEKERGIRVACMLSRFSHVQLFAALWTEPTRLLCPWDSPDKNTGVGCHALLQRIFLTQGSNQSFLHCTQILLSHSRRLWLNPLKSQQGTGWNGAYRDHIFCVVSELEREPPANQPSIMNIIFQPSTNQARPCLASEIRRDRAHSGWYGHRL